MISICNSQLYTLAQSRRPAAQTATNFLVGSGFNLKPRTRKEV